MAKLALFINYQENNPCSHISQELLQYLNFAEELAKQGHHIHVFTKRPKVPVPRDQFSIPISYPFEKWSFLEAFYWLKNNISNNYDILYLLNPLELPKPFIYFHLPWIKQTLEVFKNTKLVSHIINLENMKFLKKQKLQFLIDLSQFTVSNSLISNSKIYYFPLVFQPKVSLKKHWVEDSFNSFIYAPEFDLQLNSYSNHLEMYSELAQAFRNISIVISSPLEKKVSPKSATNDLKLIQDLFIQKGVESQVLWIDTLEPEEDLSLKYRAQYILAVHIQPIKELQILFQESLFSQVPLVLSQQQVDALNIKYPQNMKNLIILKDGRTEKVFETLATIHFQEEQHSSQLKHFEDLKLGVSPLMKNDPQSNENYKDYHLNQLNRKILQLFSENPPHNSTQND